MIIRKLRKWVRRVLAVGLFAVNIFSCWMWWESYKMHVCWGKRGELFPMPFGVAYIPHWIIIDLSITLISVSSFVLTLLALGGDGDAE
jgi:hypothetical protein